MKLVIAVVQERDSDGIVEAFLERGFFVTRIDSTGGFLREANATLLVAVQTAHLAEVLGMLRQFGQARVRYVNPLLPVVEPVEFHVAAPVEVFIGGATVFVLPIERYERIA